MNKQESLLIFLSKYSSFFVIAISICILNSSCGSNKEEEAKRKEQFERLQAYNHEKNSLIQLYSADTTWGTKLLGGEEIRYYVKTLELERVWILNKPIYLEGGLLDISTYDDKYYLVEFEFNNDQFPDLLLMDFYFKLLYPKNQIDSLLIEYPKLLTDFLSYLDYRCLIVAKINSIEKPITSNPSEYDNDRFGTGLGIDIKVIDD